MATLVRDLAPDLILYNGQVVTLNDALPRCTAIACKDGRVVAIGDDAEVLALAGERTGRIDLEGEDGDPRAE
ncbi:MAG: hypothetical protein U0232_09800 [Thermomicrobiales bacterium]